MAKPSNADQDQQPVIPPPPSKAGVDQISRDQALIADEWAPQPDQSDTAKPE